MKKIYCVIALLYTALAFGGDDYQREVIPMDYQDLAGVAGRAMLFDGSIDTYDDEEAEIELPFPFLFYGQEYNNLRVSTNGYLVFLNQSATEYDNDSLPNPQGPNGIIAVFWDDLEVGPNGGIVDQISYVVQGEAPNRVLIVDYRSVEIRAEGNPTNDLIWAQAKLYEGSHVIEFHYNSFLSDTNDGYTNATIGLEHPCGCIAEPGPNYNNDNDTVPDVAYRYTPPQYYDRSEINLDYQDMDGVAGRMMLFDGSENTYDDTSAEIELPFSFKFYGKAYQNLRVSTNGYLVFPDGETSNEYDNNSLPSAQHPDGIIAVFWDDLQVAQNAGGTDQISYVVQGEAPNRVLIVDYRSVQIRADGNGPTDDHLWAQAKLYEGSNVIEFHYSSFLSDTDDGYTNATIGLEHPCGCIAEPGPNYNNDNDVVPQKGYRYVPSYFPFFGSDLIFMDGFDEPEVL